MEIGFYRIARVSRIFPNFRGETIWMILKKRETISRRSIFFFFFQRRIRSKDFSEKKKFRSEIEMNERSTTWAFLKTDEK